MISAAKMRFRKIKPYLPAICFLGGFTWDNLTLVRVDNRLDMSIFAAYLALAGTAIVLIGRKVRFRFSEHLPLAVQFFFGGLFSSFVVYYFKSASSIPALLFMLMLLGLLVGNEFMEKKLGDVRLAAFLFAITSFMYLNVVIPVLLKQMNAFTFLAAIVVSATLFALVRLLIDPKAIPIAPTIAVYVFLVAAYFMNVIPPVPLAKKHMGIYRSVTRTGEGYRCSYTQPAWYRFMYKGERVYRWAPGDTVFCFTSIFAPTQLRKEVFHHWYTKAEGSSRWRKTDTMGYALVGGRDGGYRGYTFKRSLTPGPWKIALKTVDGKTLGIVRFTVVPRPTEEYLITRERSY